MSTDVVIHPTMLSPTIVGIGGFPERAMAEYVLGLARGQGRGRRLLVRRHRLDGASGHDGGGRRGAGRARRGVASGAPAMATGGSPRVRARPRRDPRRRREHRQCARRLAGARTRRDPAGGLARRNRPHRLERRDDLLVRGGRDGLVRPAARGDAGRARAPAGERLPALRRRGSAPAGVPPARGRGISGGDRAGRRGRRALQRDGAGRGGRDACGLARLPRRAWTARRRWQVRLL